MQRRKTLAEKGTELHSDEITSRSREILRILFKRSKPVTVFRVQVKQADLAKGLNITRQALNIHLKKLRDGEYISTGRGFIDILEAGLSFMGRAGQPQFIFTKVSPKKRDSAYKEISRLPTRSIYRVTGDMDLVIIVDRDKLDDVLRGISSIDGVKETRSYATIEALK